MTTKATVKDSKGKDIEIDVFTVEELKTLYEDESGNGKKAAMAHLRALGAELAVIVKMKADKRVEWTLERYKELGFAPNGATKGKATGAKLGTANGKPAAMNGKAATAAAAAATKGKATGAQAADEEEEEEDAPPAKAPASGAAPAGNGEVLKLLKALVEKVDAQAETIAGLQGTVEILQGTLAQQEKLLLDVHLITQVIARAGHDFDEEAVLSFAPEYYDRLIVEPKDSSDDEGEGEQLAGNA